MENHSADQTMILSMKISCCKGCPKILMKKLLKMEGVGSATIDTKKDLVFVKGTIDSTTLLNNVAKLGKKVQLQPTDEQKNKRRDDSTAPKTRKTHKNCCCKDGRHASKKNNNVEEEEHKYGRVDPPEKITPSGPGRLPFYSGVGPYGGGYGGGSYPYQGRYGNEPQPYGYIQQPGNEPQPYGYIQQPGNEPQPYGYIQQPGNEPHPYGYAQQPRLCPEHPFGCQYRQ